MKKIETTRHLKNETVLRIYKKGYGYSKLEIFDCNDLYIAVFSDDTFFSCINDGDLIDVYVWVEQAAAYEFTTSVIGRISKGLKILFLSHCEKLTHSKKRKCLTAEVELPVRFFTFDTGNNTKSITTEEIEYFNGEIILLQDREAAVRSAVPLTEDDFFKGHISINNEDIELVGKISGINKAKNIYNIVFTGMNDKMRNKILDYIFSIYRE